MFQWLPAAAECLGIGTVGIQESAITGTLWMSAAKVERACRTEHTPVPREERMAFGTRRAATQVVAYRIPLVSGGGRGQANDRGRSAPEVRKERGPALAAYYPSDYSASNQKCHYHQSPSVQVNHARY